MRRAFEPHARCSPPSCGRRVRVDLGLVQRSDLTGFNWANVPAVLVECGFMTNPAEARLLRSNAYQLKIARGLTAGAEAFAPL